MDIKLLELFFPKGLLALFNVSTYELKATGYEFHLDEKFIVPDGYKRSELESKGFLEAVRIVDFPIRGKQCVHKVRRRKWLVKKTGEVITRDWNIVAKGTRTTEDFASFLKGLNR